MSSEDRRRSFVLANAYKEGDLLVGGTRDDLVRDEARRLLLNTRIADIRRMVLVDDGVTAALDRARDRRHDATLDPLTISDLKRILLAPEGPAWATTHRDALPSDVAAAIAKVMTDDELSSVATRLFNPLPGPDLTIGAPLHFGSRIQPNSPGDDEDEILFSTLEGLAFGCGDVIIGLNPASDDVETIVRLEQLLDRIVRSLDLPARFCVLSDIVKQQQAQARARVDVGFQSLAGTSRALAGMISLDVDGVLDLAGGFSGLYFETGQGSEVTNGAACGVDMVTLEARTYGVARYIQRRTNRWTIVNDVAGFIGPEVFTTADQLERACLEDIVMAKLHGLTMGLDVCATFHMGIPPAVLRDVTQRVVERAAPAYLMAVAGNADPMLGYLTTSFREHPRLRRRTGRRMTSAMEARLAALGVADGDDTATAAAAPTLYAAYARAQGEQRTFQALADEARQRVLALRERSYDLGEASGLAGASPLDADTRIEALYIHARRALYAAIDEGVIRDACLEPLRVRTRAATRDEYLARPSTGERIDPEDARQVAAIAGAQPPQVQIVVSDGLNANAVNEQLRAVLPPLRRQLAAAGCHVAARDVVVQNGRVRVGYEIGALTDAPVVVHFIGERPGTGLDTLSAYLTYGRDESGRARWDPAMDHACTTAICGIDPRGKAPDAAVAEIAGAVLRMLEERRSGVPSRRLV